MGVRAEVWTRPGHASFGHVDTIDSPIKLGATRRGGGLGEGDMSLPADLDAARLNAILFADKDAPANDVTALIRYYRDGQTSGSDTPFFEWLADGRVPPSTVEQPNLTVSGLDINSLFGWGSVEAWDWDGSADWQSNFPDWIWGGRNLLGVLEGRYLPEVVTLTITATAGTVTVTVTNDSGSDTTAGVAFNGSALDWKLAIQALSNVTLVDVDGPAGGPFRLTFTDSNANTVVGSSAGANITVVQQGKIVPAGYEESRSYVSDLPHGFLAEYRMWETGDPALPAGCDTAVMFNGTEPDYPGFQRVVRVRPGGVYQVRSKVTSTQAGDDVRMVVRDMAENEIGGAGNGRDEQTIAVAGTFQDFEIQNLVIPEDVSEVIVRWGHVDVPGVDPGRIFVACPAFREGLAADTVGAILLALYNDAQVDHVADGRQVWGSGPFLELDFDATNDSGGNAWSESEVSVRFNLNTNYSLVLAEFGRRGYEWRVIPKQQKTANPADDGVWLLQVFNPGTAGTDYSAASDPAILSGTDVIARAARMFAPSATMVRVQGADGYTSRSVSADAVGAVGRREAGVQAADLFSLADTAAVSAAELADRLSRAESISPTVRPTPGVDPIPGVDFDVFDSLNVADVPYVAKADRRLAAWTATFTPDIPEGEFLLSFTAETFVGQSAVNAGVRRLLRDFEAIRQAPQEQPNELESVIGSGRIPFLVAAADSDTRWKKAAQFQCTGAQDNLTIQAAIEEAATGLVHGGTVFLAPGTYSLQIDQNYPNNGGSAIWLYQGVSLRAAGSTGSAVASDLGVFLVDDNPPSTPTFSYMDLVAGGGQNTLEGLVVQTYTEGLGSVGLGFSSEILNCQIESDYRGIALAAFSRVVDCYVEVYNVDPADAEASIVVLQGAVDWTIRHNYIRNGPIGVAVNPAESTTPARWRIEDNYFLGTGHEAIAVFGRESGGNIINESYAYSFIRGNLIQSCGQQGAREYAAIWVKGEPNQSPDDETDGDEGHLIIADNIIEAVNESAGPVGGHGIWLEDTRQISVHDNQIENPEGHGIWLDGSVRIKCINNDISWPSASSDTYDGVHLSGPGGWNDVRGNTVTENDKGSPVFWRYGINVADASQQCNIVAVNDLTLAGGGTDYLNDSGTGTRLDIPTDPTYGSNFTACDTSPTSP